MKTRKILIVGAGGIGSWMAPDLHNLKNDGQLNDILITYADDDTVDTKNLLYQNFMKLDVFDTKVEVLSRMYGIDVIDKRITTHKQLQNFDCIVSAVDNTPFRKLLFEFAEENPEVYWIDLRSEGKSFAIFTKNKNNTLEKMISTLPKKIESSSCQLTYELENNIIQRGNRMAAAYGVSYILNWVRGDYNPPKFTHSL